jgi:isoquinoline 1-oxidoreductase subunit beta
MSNLDRFSDVDPAFDPEVVEPLEFDFGLTRRHFTQLLGGGLLITLGHLPSLGQQAGRRDNGGSPVSARIHLGSDGIFTVLTGKIEMGQGARAQLSQAAAEELHVPVDRIRMVMGDTERVPDDGLTAGSRTTPATVPSVRRGAAAARQILVELACAEWGVPATAALVQNGVVTHPPTGRSTRYGELARLETLPKAFEQRIPPGVTVTSVPEWRVFGSSIARPNARDLLTGAHRFPSDWVRPGMLRGKVLRPPSYGARLVSIDLEPARTMDGVAAVRDGEFVGVVAPTTHRARQALAAIAATARWQTAPHPASRQLYDHLREQAQGDFPSNPFTAQLVDARHHLRQTYRVAYVQHAPLEPRAAIAEWSDDRLTVWTGTQNPFGYRRELARAFHLAEDHVRVIVPDFGGGFGGKHTGETAVEAARLARAAGRPVSLVWTRSEEFTWAYFRPAAVIEAEASLDADGRLTSWHFVNINAGGSAIDTPYRAGEARSRSVNSAPPLRQGSYRALGSTANNFAREVFMDELADLAGVDPLDFRLAHLENPRLRAVLEEAARRFDWRGRVRRKQPTTGVGLACGTEKGSYVAACVEIEFVADPAHIEVRHVCEVFECGAVMNPANLVAQIQGCILMALGPALREAIQFENGKLLNGTFAQYRVPRFSDVPELDIHILDRRDLPSVGAGETPIIAVTPAIANALFRITGSRVRDMPIPP